MLKKLSVFLYAFKKSFSPSYYKDVLKARFSFSFKYFITFCFFLSLATATAYSIASYTPTRRFVKAILPQIPKIFPKDLDLKIKNGQVFVNIDPYFLSFKDLFLSPSSIKELEKQGLENFLVINTKAKPSEILDYGTLVFLTKNTLVIRTETKGESIRIIPLKEVDFILNKQVLEKFWQEVTPFFAWIIPGIIFFIFVFTLIFIPATNFIRLLFFSPIIWLAALLLKLKISWQKSLQILLHSFTLPTTIVIVFSSLGIFPKVPLFYSIILLIFTLIILFSFKEKSPKIPQ